MARILFLLNENPPSKEKFISRTPITVSNFVYPNSLALKELGIEQYMGISRKYASSLSCTNAPIRFLNIPIYRNIFDIKNILIAYKRINKYIKEQQIDYIHCNTPIGGFLGRVCGKRCNVKSVIYTAHGFHFYKGAPLINWLVYYVIEWFLAHWTDALIVMNKEDYQNGVKFCLRNNGRIHIVPGVGIDINSIQQTPVLKNIRDELRINRESILCISVGDIIKRKNYQIAVKAFINLPPNIHYIICGEGPELKKLQALAKRLGLQDRIHFLGHRKDIFNLLKQSDIFLLSSLQEGLPRSLMEAMACGLPCVVSEIRGNVDLVDDRVGGFLVNKYDSSTFAEKIKFLSKNKELMKQMGESNQKKITAYSSDDVYFKLKRIYLETFEGL